MRPGQLVLIDAGVEVDSLYTADVTRTLPVDGVFTDAQRRVYEVVLEAAAVSLYLALWNRTDEVATEGFEVWRDRARVTWS